MASNLLNYHDALAQLLDTHHPLPGEQAVPLAALHQRVLARDMTVQLDVPAFDNSAMDGYAICGNDAARWRVVQRIAAGDGGEQPLAHGEAARIFTGAPVPPGTTAVVIQEQVLREEKEGEVFIQVQPDEDGTPRTIKEGQNIRRRAEELRAGERLLAAHQSLGAAAIGLLAIQGYAQVPCVPQVRVRVFSTGNELIEPGKVAPADLPRGGIYDSNRTMVMAALQPYGFAVSGGGCLPDQLAATRAALLEAAREADAIVCSGGVSVGEEDHLKNALQEVGELTQWRLSIKPGKPFAWGRIRREDGGVCHVFLLPGNPVSSLVAFQMLALPALLRLAGLPPEQARPWAVQARAAFTRQKTDFRREFLRVQLTSLPDGSCEVRPLALQGSAMLSAAAAANALVEIPPETPVEAGQLLAVYPMGRF